jgi:tRNA uridine 5-carboxymethylaminomethyl modification enzyme
MMTARAEYRLALRADNATTRLGKAAVDASCVSARRQAHIEEHFEARRRPEWAETEEGKADALYAPYVARQEREWGAVKRDTHVLIPPHLDFASIPGISTEMAERLQTARPETLDQASRVRGVTPAALSTLYVAASRRAA